MHCDDYGLVHRVSVPKVLHRLKQVVYLNRLTVRCLQDVANGIHSYLHDLSRYITGCFVLDQVPEDRHSVMLILGGKFA